MTVLTDAIAALSPTHYWKLDETSGTTAFDIGSGTTRDMTHSNSPSLAVSGPTDDDVGVQYNGTNQSTGLVLTGGASDVGSSNTGTLLYFGLAASQNQRMVCFADSGNLGFTWDWFLSSDFAFSSATLTNTGTVRSVETADINDVAPGVWTMMAFVHVGTVMTGWCSTSFIPAGNWVLSGAGSPDGSDWIDFVAFEANVDRFSFGVLDRSSPIFGASSVSNVAYFDGVALSEAQLQTIFDASQGIGGDGNDTVQNTTRNTAENTAR